LENISLFSFNSVDLASFQNAFSQNFKLLKENNYNFKMLAVQKHGTPSSSQIAFYWLSKHF